MGRTGEWLRQVVDNLKIARRFVELDVHDFGRVHNAEERSHRLEIVVINLPHKTGLRGIAHPGNDGRVGVEHFGVPALVHGAIGLVICHLRFAHKVGHVAECAVAGGNLGGVVLRARVAAGKVVLGPVVVDAVPIFLWHHAVD